MTHPSAAQKRKKRREQKLLEEEQQILETAEKARQAPVSTFRPLQSPTAPVLVSHAPVAPHSVSTQPLFDPTLDDPAATPIHSVCVVPTPTIPPCIPQPAAPREARTPPPLGLPQFPVQFLPYQMDAGPLLPPSQWPDHVGAFIYGPNQSWADDIPQPAPTIVMSISHASRNWAALSVGRHPWHAIRRRKRRLRADCSWEQPTYGFEAPPPTVPLLLPLPPPLEAWPCNLSLRPADLLGLVPLHLDNPIHPDVVPLEALPPPRSSAQALIYLHKKSSSLPANAPAEPHLHPRLAEEWHEIIRNVARVAASASSDEPSRWRPVPPLTSHQGGGQCLLWRPQRLGSSGDKHEYMAAVNSPALPQYSNRLVGVMPSVIGNWWVAKLVPSLTRR
ncbi:hypothetical protein K438DRAFT_1760832 [Mycena galopus ATCC 62051]|nr:hypothetical protein K438DRAFT_1760832 [Mycena galopus ATCC 62051]